MNLSEILASITTLVTIGVAAYSIFLTIKTIKQNDVILINRRIL